MPANSWPENDSYNELDPLNSLLSDISIAEDLQAEVEMNDLSLPSRFQSRRRKAALVLTLVWSGTVALNLISWGSLFVLGLTTILSLHALVTVFTKPRENTSQIQGGFPQVSLMVAAKNEEAVISNITYNLCNLDYPSGKYEVWIVDDNSSDRTPQLLATLAEQYANLKVFRRSPDDGGGKSGALNQILPLTKGEILAVFDADAQVRSDILQQVIPIFGREKVGAVQVRKAIANVNTNFWTRGQMAEMALDAYMQQQRAAIGGIEELRGNGQFVRRQALLSCGGWNEGTITDDLDLTLRLHLSRWDINFILFPAVFEEGVTQLISLWHQRSRWAEGGYQRYLDYWDLILRNRMGVRKTWDLLMFAITMYIFPMAAVPDLIMAIIKHRLPLFIPISSLTVIMSLNGMFHGLRRIYQDKSFRASDYLRILLQTLQGTLYMLHWFVVVSATTIRMSVRPKSLKWVKTIHQG